MYRRSILRIAQVTASLVVLGAVVGGLLGAGLAVLLDFRVGDFHPRAEALFIGAEFGAVVGAALAPIAAWTFMRRVPLWRAIAETAAGTVLGTIVGLIFQPLRDTAWLSPPLLGVAGFSLASIRLWYASRARAVPSAVDSQTD